MSDINEYIWDAIVTGEGRVYHTGKGKEFTYQVKRSKEGEMLSEIVIDGRRGSITRSTILLAGHQAVELQKKKGCVANHRKLGSFGSEYLYPIFLEMGLCTASPADKEEI